MARSRQPRYTAEFKSEAVRLVRSSPDSIAKIARDVGVTPQSLRLWVQAAQPATPSLTDDERSELRRLRRENRELRMERDILKKATAFFAKHSDDDSR